MDWGAGHVIFGGLTADFFHLTGFGTAWGATTANLLDNIFGHAAGFIVSNAAPTAPVDSDATGDFPPVDATVAEDLAGGYRLTS